MSDVCVCVLPGTTRRPVCCDHDRARAGFKSMVQIIVASVGEVLLF